MSTTTPKTAYLIFTEDGLDQVCETKRDTARELKDLREYNQAHLAMPVRWDVQDKVISTFNTMVADGTSWRVAVRNLRRDYADF